MSTENSTNPSSKIAIVTVAAALFSPKISDSRARRLFMIFPF